MTYTVAALMRDGTLKLILSGEGRPDQSPAQRRKRIPKNLVKFKHLRKPLARDLLVKFEPTLVDPTTLEDFSEEDLVGMVKKALNVDGDRNIPVDEYPQMAFTDDFVAICNHRYIQCGRLLQAFGSGFEGMKPIFEVSDLQIKCSVHPNIFIDVPVAESLMTDDNWALVNPWDMSCELQIFKPKRSFSLKDARLAGTSASSEGGNFGRATLLCRASSVPLKHKQVGNHSSLLSLVQETISKPFCWLRHGCRNRPRSHPLDRCVPPRTPMSTTNQPRAQILRHSNPVNAASGGASAPGSFKRIPGVLLRDPGVLLKDSGVLLKDPGVL